MTDFTITVPQTTVVNYRQANAVNLAARHVSERSANRIKGHVLSNGLVVWKVESQTVAGKVYTVTRKADGWEYDTCTCGDHVGRHATCKHQKAVDLLVPVSEAKPVAAESRGPNWNDRPWDSPENWTVPSERVTERMIQTAKAGRKGRHQVQEEI
jgi:hypothetical protein